VIFRGHLASLYNTQLKTKFVLVSGTSATVELLVYNNCICSNNNNNNNKTTIYKAQ